MKNPNPSKDSTAAPPPSSPQHPPPGDDVVPTPTGITNPTTEEGRAEGAGEILKTPMEVLAELTAGSGDEGDGYDGGSGSGSVPLGSGGGGAMAVPVAVGVGGGGIVISGHGNIHRRKSTSGVQVAVKEKETKKPRQSEVKDPPTGTPTCPICQRQFATWKGAFGHMRSHPNREYRGFFRPPVFGSSLPPSAPAPAPAPAMVVPSKGGDGGGSSKGDGAKGGEKRAAFDLNNPFMEGEGSSSAAAAGGNEAREPAAEEERVPEEGRKNLRPFDLNEMAKDDDDEA